MSQVRWHYKVQTNPADQHITCFFEGASAEVMAFTEVPDDKATSDAFDQFLRGDPVELRLDFVYCHCSDSPSLDTLGSALESANGLHLDLQSCKQTDAAFCDEVPDEYIDAQDDTFYGAGVMRRFPSQDGKPGEICFELDQETTTGIVQQLLTRRALADFQTFRIFSQIAPESFNLRSLRFIGLEANQPAEASEQTQARRTVDRFNPPTSTKTSLTNQEFVELLKDPDARLSYRQIINCLMCKPDTLKKHLINAKLARKGVRLTDNTFSTAELVSDLVPYLQRLPQQGQKVDRFLRLFDKAGHISKYRID